MDWSVAAAKQRLSELVRQSGREPQKILSHSRLVAVVVDPASYEEFLAWKKAREGGSVYDALADLRSACAETGYRIDVPRRRNRRRSFPRAR